MLEVIMFFRRLVRMPRDLATGVFRVFNSNFNETPKQRAMMLGLPAVGIAILGLAFLGLSQASKNSRLEPWYSNLSDKIDDKKTAIRADLQKIRQEKLSKRNGNDSDLRPTDGGQTLEEREAEKQEELDELLAEQQIYLQKLIDLDPGNHEHRFALAQTYDNSKSNQLRAIMNTLAPEDKAVFYKAHSHMARLYYAQSQAVTTKNEKLLLLEKARIHADHWLTQQPDENTPKEIKARVFQEEERYNDAYEIYEKLFKGEPAYYVEMVRINNERGTPENNKSVLNSARKQFKARLTRNKQDDSSVWVNSWMHIIKCRVIEKNFETAIAELEAEWNRERDDTRKAFLEKEIGTVYTVWANSEFRINGSLEERRANLDRLREAIKRDNKSVLARNLITRYVNNDPALADEAKIIYDPTTDRDAPALALSDLGARALREHDYASAIDYFERASKGNPDNPLILNNLAYSYLVSEEKETSDQALYLVNEAIDKLLNNESHGKARIHLSSLYHTRGTALMRLSRLEEAAASFELSLSERPEHILTLESLVQCYEGRLDEQAEFIRGYLKELKAIESQNNAQQEN